MAEDDGRTVVGGDNARDGAENEEKLGVGDVVRGEGGAGIWRKRYWRGQTLLKIRLQLADLLYLFPEQFVFRLGTSGQDAPL